MATSAFTKLLSTNPNPGAKAAPAATPTAPAAPKKSASAFSTLIAKTPPVGVTKTGIDVSSHVANPLSQANAQYAAEQNKNTPTQSGWKNFVSSLLPATKEVGSLIAGKKSLPAMIGKQAVEQYTKPSEIEQKIEKQSVATPGAPPVLKQAGIAVLRTLTPLVEGFGTIVGSDILGQNEQSARLANEASLQGTKTKNTVGKQVQTTVPDTLVTHKLTPEEVTNVFLNSVQVGLALAPFVTDVVKSGSLNFADIISKNSKVPITYSDLQKITTSATDAEAIARVGKEKFSAYTEATQKNAVRQSLKQGYVELAQKEPNVFANILRNAATRPVSEIANFAKPYGNPVYVPNVGLLPERITFQEAQKVDPAILEKNYEPKLENNVVDYQIKQDLLPAPKEPVALLNERNPKPAVIEGNGFTVTDKANPEKVAIMKSINDYKKAVSDFSTKPTPTRLARVKKLRAAMDVLKTGGHITVTPVETPKVTAVKTPEIKAKVSQKTDVNTASSAISYIDKNGQKVYTKLSPQELSVLRDEVKNIPTAKGGSQIHLDAITPQQQANGKEISRAEFISGHPQAQEVFNNAVKPAAPIAAEPIVPKASKVGKSIEAKALEKSLTNSFGGTAEYTPVTIKDQAERAAKIINTDLAAAKQMVLGEKPLPDGLRAATIIKAMEEHALKTGDVELLRNIANSPLTAETSVHAQELRLLAERDPESAVTNIQKVEKARSNAATKRFGAKQITKMKSELKTEITKKAPKAKDWSEFLQELKCT